jgi:hypothetical protein
MKWLVTFAKNTDIEVLQKHLQQWKCDLLKDSSPISLDDLEEVIEVEGPQDLPKLASSSHLNIKVYPNSKVEPFIRSDR